MIGTAYYVPAELLINVSPLIREACLDRARPLILEGLSVQAFRVFLGWLLHRTVVEEGQVTLAKAWLFAANYHIRPLQNAVMRKLFGLLSGDLVEPEAVSAAYQGGEDGKMLQKAFVAQIAHEMVANKSWSWGRDAVSTLGQDCHFMVDPVLAMKGAGAIERGDLDGGSLADVLVEES